MPILTVRQDDVAPAVAPARKVAAMARRRDRSEEIRKLASALFRLMREHEIANTTRLKVTAPLHRVLVHSKEYRALRGRQKQGEGRMAKDPSFFTIADAARDLNLPICALV